MFQVPSSVLQTEIQQQSADMDSTQSFYLHARYHPKLIPAHVIQQTFQKQIIKPESEPAVTSLTNHRNVYLPPHQLTVAYHRSANLQNLLSCRKMDSGVPVSTIQRDATRDTINPKP